MSEIKYKGLKYDQCEWNPIKNRAAIKSDKSHADSTWIIGTKNKWSLCDDCVILPKFKRFKKRIQSKKLSMMENFTYLCFGGKPRPLGRGCRACF